MSTLEYQLKDLTTDDLGAYCDWLFEREEEYWEDLITKDTHYLYETPEIERRAV